MGSCGGFSALGLAADVWGEVSFPRLLPWKLTWGLCTPEVLRWALERFVAPSPHRDAELAVVREQRNRLCDLLGVPRPQLVPQVMPSPHSMRRLCFPEPSNVLGPAAVLSFCQCIHTVHSLISCQDPWDYGTSRAAFSGHCPHMWAPVASRPLALGHVWGAGEGVGLASA